MNANDPIKHLVSQFAKLPGIGERTALRLVLHLVSANRDLMNTLAGALSDVADKVSECAQCCMLTADEGVCSICRAPGRDQTTVCVVASVQDLMAIEATAEYRGLYHVLHGTLAPMEGIGPGEIRIAPFLSRLTDGASNINEVIIATPPSVEGEATALYLTDQIEDTDISLTRIASGVPVGGDLQFADRLTLSRAIALRRGI